MTEPLFRYARNRQEGDLNTGKFWSEMDDWDLKNHNKQGVTVAETAIFLMRTHDEIFDRSRELGVEWSERQRRPDDLSES
jgi:hypothetical protein